MIEAGIILLIIIVIILFYRQRGKGDSCCDVNDEVIKEIKVKDRHKSHYSNHYECEIGLMTCRSCAIKVQNTLNQIDGVWAKVDIASKKAQVLSKELLDEENVRKRINETGYTILNIRKIQ